MSYVVIDPSAQAMPRILHKPVCVSGVKSVALQRSWLYLDRVSALYQKQLAMITDVLDLKARVDALAAQEVDARNQVSLSRAALSEIVGRPVTEKLSRICSDVAGLQLSVPIYSGGSTSARVSGLYQDQVSAEQQLEATRRQVVKEITNAYLTADSSVEKIRADRNALASAEQSSIASQKAFTYGVVNAVDVLTSVQNEFKARRDLLKAQYGFITNLFILNRWACKQSSESVESVNVWLGNNKKPDAGLP